MILKNQKGQSLVEYLILTALLAVAAMGIVRLLGQSISAKFADVTNAIQGEGGRKAQVEKVDENLYRKKDMSDFMRGAVARDQKN